MVCIGNYQKFMESIYKMEQTITLMYTDNGSYLDTLNDK